MDYFFLGDPELVTAFRFVGIAGVSIQNVDAAQEAFRQITENGENIAETEFSGAQQCRVLILTEEVADWLGETVIQWQLSDRYPLIVEVPALMGRLPGRKSLVELIREAIGIHL